MDDDVAFYDFVFKLLDLFLIHRLDLVVTLQIGFLKMFEFPLQLLELTSDTFVLGSKGFVLIFKGQIDPVVLLP